MAHHTHSLSNVGPRTHHGIHQTPDRGGISFLLPRI
ncbi:hypothetical protein OROHE_026642 [Orobanche hederae]